MPWVPNTVVAKVHNKPSFEDGFADSELAPGMGAVIEENDEETHKTIVGASLDSQTTRLVREPRNPPQAVEPGAPTTPLASTIEADRLTETVGFNDHDEARARVADSVTADDDELGWTDNSDLAAVDGEAGSPTVAVGRLIRLITDVSDDFNMALVEFY